MIKYLILFLIFFVYKIDLQLSLTLAWDRVDILQSEVLKNNQDLSMHAFNNFMINILLLNRVEFVKILLENGLSLKKFLTINRLEDLYNRVLKNCY